MAQFPRDETGVLGLAQEIADGLAANRSTYPAPPVSTEDLNAATADCVAARDAVQAAKAALEEYARTMARWLGPTSRIFVPIRCILIR